jgi:hypothetical protein
VEAVLEHVRAELPFDLEIFNIDEDVALKVKYGWDIPVVTVDGEFLAKHRLEEKLLRQRLA